MERPGRGQIRRQLFFIQTSTPKFCVGLLMTKRPRVELPGNRPFPYPMLSQDEDRTVTFRNACYCRTYVFPRDEWTRFEHQVRDHSLLTVEVSTRASPVAMRFPNRRWPQMLFSRRGFAS